MLKLTKTAAGLFIACSLASQYAFSEGGYAVYTSESGFSDVMEGVKMAIEERGMYINNVMNIGEMLERTGKDLGAEEQLFTRAESFEFCSAGLSREMSGENPAHVVNCPFIMTVYTLPNEPDTTYVVHREIPADQIAASPAMAKVAEMLKSVASAGVEW